jgi:hypothetical protein
LANGDGADGARVVADAMSSSDERGATAAWATDQG